MHKYPREIVRVPNLEMVECPGSWLSRLALNQGIEIRQLLRYLHLPMSGDIDLVFTRANLRRIAGVCGLSHKEFSLIRKMYLGVLRLDRTGTKYLLKHNNSSRYRFCASCLHEQNEKYFPIHWRFDAWRWCPEHNCLLDDKCPHCLSPVVLPANMLIAGSKKEGVRNLGFCMSCSQKLSTKQEDLRGTLNFLLLTPLESDTLKNGRALLAALYRNEVWVDSKRVGFPLRTVRRIERGGLLPNAYFKLTLDELNRRRQTLKKLHSTEIVNENLRP